MSPGWPGRAIAPSVLRRVPLLAAFGELARLRGARSLADLPGHVDAFVAERARESRDARRGTGINSRQDIRGPVEQFLELVVPGFEGSGRPHHRMPFAATLPGFFEYLAAERGLRPSITSYRHHLDRFEAYLERVEGSPGWANCLRRCSAPLSPSGRGLAWPRPRCGRAAGYCVSSCAMRTGKGWSAATCGRRWNGRRPTGCPPSPCSISWEEVGKVLDTVDRRTRCGKRDYAILLLLATYGLRGREVAALTLDDIDWKRERLAIPERKAWRLDRVPAISPRPARRWPTTSGMAGRRPLTGISSSGLLLPSSRSAPPRSPYAPGATCWRRGSRCLARGRTRCAIA